MVSKNYWIISSVLFNSNYPYVTPITNCAWTRCMRLDYVKSYCFLYSAFTIIQDSKVPYNSITPSAQAFFSPFRRILHRVQPYSWRF